MALALNGNMVRRCRTARSSALRLALTAIHTPGHTDESMTYTVVDSARGCHHGVYRRCSVCRRGWQDRPVWARTGRKAGFGALREHSPEDTAIGRWRHTVSWAWWRVGVRFAYLGQGRKQPGHRTGAESGVAVDQKEFLRHKTLERLETPPYFTQMEKYNLEGLRCLAIASAAELRHANSEMKWRGCGCH